MIKNILIILILVFGFSFSEVSHSGLTGTNIHTVYRWQFADSAARVNQSVVAADTMKLGYQRSDSTSWVLVATTGAKWKKIAYASNQNTLTTSTMTLDSLKLTKGINATGGTFSGALTSTTLNTGNGAFDSTRTRVSVFDSVKLGTGSYLKNYVEGSFPCTLKTSDVTVQQIGTAYYTKMGNVLTMSFPELSGTSNSGSLVIYCVMPFAPKQQLAGYGYDKTSVTVTDNGSTLNARAAVSWNPTIINRIIFNIIPTATFTSSGTKGISPFTIRYITE